MSNVSKRRRLHNVFVSLDRMKRRKARNRNRKKQLAQDFVFEASQRDPITGLFPKRIYAPERFSISRDDSRAIMFDFLERIRYYVIEMNRRVYIDFSKTKKMIADGTLLFYAEMHRLAFVTRPVKMVFCSYPKNKIVEQVLQHVKVFDVLGKRKRRAVLHATVRYWNSQTGVRFEGEKIESVRTFYEQIINPGQDPSKLYNGISEAMINSGHHGYPDEESLKVWGLLGDARWWMFSQEVNGVLWVTFYDLGIGIPDSLRSGRDWSLPEILHELSGIQLGRSDGAHIELAFRLGTSITGKPNRGKGLPEVRAVLKEHGMGKLRVFSGRGYYEYNAERDAVKVANFDLPLRGTMISWNMPVKSKTMEKQ